MTARATRTVAGAAAVIAAVTLASRVVGFLRWLVFNHEVGATCAGTVYSSANLVPNVLFEVATGGALAAVVVPLVAGRLGRQDHPGADAAASALLTWSVLVLTPLGLVLCLLAEPLAGVLLGDEQCTGATDLAATMLRVFSVQLPLYGIGIVLAGVLQAHRRFLMAALAPLLSSLVVVAAYLWFGAIAEGAQDRIPALPAPAVSVLAWGTTAGVVALSLPLLAPVALAGVRLRPRVRFPDGAGGQARALAGAGVLALLAQQVAVLGTMLLSNHVGGRGAINVYQYVQAVYVLPYAVLAVPLATSVFPVLAAAGRPAADAAASRVPTVLARAVRATVLAMVAAAAALVAAAGPIGQLFARLGLGAEVVAPAMPVGVAAFAPGLLGFGLLALLSRAAYAAGASRAAATWQAGGWLLAIAVPTLALAITHGQGVRATLLWLGIGSSLGMTLAGAGLLRATRTVWGADALAGLPRVLAWTLPVAVLAGAAGWWLLASWQAPTALSAVLHGALAGGVAGAAVLAVGAIADPVALQRITRRREVGSR